MKKLLVLLGILLATGASAQERAKTLIVGVEAQAFAPHYFLNGQGEYRGYARDLLDRFAEANGLHLVYKPLPVDQLLPALLDGRVDLKYPDNIQWGSVLKAKTPMVYSQPLTDYVDGVLVPPGQRGAGLDALGRLTVAKGWTLPDAPYQKRVNEGELQRVPSDDLEGMIRTALRGEVDGAFYNIVVATYYLDNIRARPGALVFDPDLPYVQSTFSLSSWKHPEVIGQMDTFLRKHAEEVAALKAEHRVESHIGTEFMGMEQWKIDFLKRQRERQAQQAATPTAE